MSLYSVKERAPNLLRLCILAGLLLAYGRAALAEERARVFAAASLTNALTDLARDWQRAGHPAPALDFASSGTLARQIDAGAPAALFASADLRWLDYLDSRGRIDHASRRNLLGTDLVLIAPAGSTLQVDMRRSFPIGSAFSGKLCTGEPGTVPAGIYARQALERLGWWPALEHRIVGTEDVRNTLAFVERGECALGIVYATDASISRTVRVVARFPADSHAPIVYPFALVNGARAEAAALLRFLCSPEAAAVFQRYGFAPLPAPGS